MTSRLPALGLMLALIGVGGCGYRMVGANSFLPETIRDIAVVPFGNRTTRPEIDQRVTEEVARELARRGRYRVVSDPATADAVLEGVISSYRTSSIALDQSGRASRVEAIVILGATLRQVEDDSVLWSQDGLIFREQFDVAASGDSIDEEGVALDDIARGAAAALITSILEGF